MKKAIIAGIAIGGLVTLGVVSYVNAYNFGNKMENAILATWENNENILAQYGNKVVEAAQVTDMQRDDLTQVIGEAMAGRYGEDGSRAVFQMITEQNPQIDSSVYTQIQRIIEAGRNDFTTQQTILADQRRVYNTALGSFVKGTFLGWAGYPKIELDKYKPISTARASEAFETGIEESIKLR